ncbi:MAG TPA: S9 family peptidase [Actinomycetota bacterium]|nr:S9 family peptidase [Actinomycetota bacterium]
MPHPIRDFLEVRSAGANGFSPDGSRVLVSSNLTGTSQLYRVARTGGELEQVTGFDEPVAGSYMPTTDDVILQHDVGGNERLQISLIDDGGRDLRELVHDPEHIHRVGGVTRDGALLAYSSNRRNGTDFDVYVRDLGTGEERCVWAPGGWCDASGFSPDGRYLAVARLTERSGDNEAHLIDLADGSTVEVAPHTDEAYVGAPHWLPDSSAFFFSASVDREFEAVHRYDMSSGRVDPVIEPDWDAACSIDEGGTTLAVRINEDGYSRVELYDPHTLRRRGELPLPGRGQVGGVRFTKDGGHACFSFVSPVEPGDAWVHDLTTGETTRLTDSPCPVPRDALVEPELHRFPSFDGESIPVFLFRPRGSRGEVPVVVQIHGGPESQYVPAFNPVTQYLVDHGFAVAAPNVRGSTGYGKRYEHLDDVRKRLDSVRDLEALHAWLGSVGGIDQRRAALMGGSYGGYMVLAGLAFQPQLWAAGVDVVGISSLVTFLENTAPWRRRFREREYGSLERDRDFLVEVSPITHVDRMRAPLMIIHGANDPRVPLGEAEQIHEVLRQKDVASELLVYHDEGHGLAKLRNRLDAYPKVADFLHRHLGA